MRYIEESELFSNGHHMLSGVSNFTYKGWDDDGDGVVDSYGIYAVGYTSSYRENQEAELLINTLASAGEAEEKAVEKGYGVFYKNANQWDVRNGRDWTDINRYGSDMNNILPNSIQGYTLRLIENVYTSNAASDEFSRRLRTWNNREYELTIPSIPSVRPQ